MTLPSPVYCSRRCRRVFISRPFSPVAKKAGKRVLFSILLPLVLACVEFNEYTMLVNEHC